MKQLPVGTRVRFIRAVFGHPESPQPLLHAQAGELGIISSTDGHGDYWVKTDGNYSRGVIAKPDVDFTVIPDVPDWVAAEVRRTWEKARDCGSQLEAFRIFERMTRRLGYRRYEDKPL